MSIIPRQYGENDVQRSDWFYHEKKKARRSSSNTSFNGHPYTRPQRRDANRIRAFYLLQFHPPASVFAVRNAKGSSVPVFFGMRICSVQISKVHAQMSNLNLRCAHGLDSTGVDSKNSRFPSSRYTYASTRGTRGDVKMHVAQNTLDNVYLERAQQTHALPTSFTQFFPLFTLARLRLPYGVATLREIKFRRIIFI